MSLVGALLRIALLGVGVRLHPDEALFAAQARTITAQDDLLLRGADLDKPPLTIYSLALAFALLGPSELAARLPNVFASVLALATLYRLVCALSGDRATGLLAALLLALSPYDLAFAATAFTDVQATLWALVAALLA
ncbi:MAG: glycosyltransferase family 39 protein, partial [Chloroflexota bacterium]